MGRSDVPSPQLLIYRRIELETVPVGPREQLPFVGRRRLELCNVVCQSGDRTEACALDHSVNKGGPDRLERMRQGQAGPGQTGEELGVEVG